MSSSGVSAREVSQADGSIYPGHWNARGNIYTRALEVDETSRFFFDHPVDHVPGMLLLDGVLGVAEEALSHTLGTQAGEETYYIAALELSFERFCEKDGAIDMQARFERAGEARHACYLQITQYDAPVCRGTIEFRPNLSVDGRVRSGPDEPIQPAPAEHVHKLHRENIFISDLRRAPGGTYRSRLLPLPADHGLQARRRPWRTPLEIVEACRQFSLLLQHAVQNTPTDKPFILASVAARFHEPLSRGARLDVASVAGQGVIPQGNGTQVLEVLEGERRVAEIAVGGRAVSPRLYARIRQARPQPTSEKRP